MQLLAQVRAHSQALSQLTQLFAQHPEAFIFSSLPGAGELLAPGLLVKLGDHRERFTTAAEVQALAGTCPVTEHSGKKKRIKFRHACDHEFRRISQQFAKASVNKSGWALAYWREVRPRCRSDSHAYRLLANRWWLSSGNCGIPVSLMTRPITCGSAPNGAAPRTGRSARFDL